MERKATPAPLGQRLATKPWAWAANLGCAFLALLAIPWLAQRNGAHIEDLEKWVDRLGFAVIFLLQVFSAWCLPRLRHMLDDRGGKGDPTVAWLRYPRMGAAAAAQPPSQWRRAPLFAAGLAVVVTAFGFLRSIAACPDALACYWLQSTPLGVSWWPAAQVAMLLSWGWLMGSAAVQGAEYMRLFWHLSLRLGRPAHRRLDFHGGGPLVEAAEAFRTKTFAAALQTWEFRTAVLGEIAQVSFLAWLAMMVPAGFLAAAWAHFSRTGQFGDLGLAQHGLAVTLGDLYFLLSVAVFLSVAAVFAFCPFFHAFLEQQRARRELRWLAAELMAGSPAPDGAAASGGTAAASESAQSDPERALALLKLADTPVLGLRQGSPAAFLVAFLAYAASYTKSYLGL